MTDCGPTIAVHITTEHIAMAIDLYALIDQAFELIEEGAPVRLRVDWNGLNARPWDMSFVPMVRRE